MSGFDTKDQLGNYNVTIEGKSGSGRAVFLADLLEAQFDEIRKILSYAQEANRRDRGGNA